jgi:phosphatidylglycerophosphate synthase
MFDQRFRTWFGRVAAAPTQVLARSGVSPNQVTVAAGALGLGAATVVASGWLRLGVGLWIVSRVLDGFDGVLARATGRVSTFGGYLDITVDMLAYSAMAVGFAVATPSDRLLWLFVLVGYVMAITSTLALSSLLERTDRVLGGDRSLQFTSSAAEGGETSAAYVLLAFLPGSSHVILSCWIALLAVTLIARTRLAARLLT